MGLLTDPGATKSLATKIDKFGDKLGALGFLAGCVWLVLQSCSVGIIMFIAVTFILARIRWVGNKLQQFFADILFSRTNSNGISGV